VFIGAGDHSFYAIDAATGQKKWAYVAGPGMVSRIYSSSPWPAPVVHDGIVYCVVQDGLHALDTTTGKRKWHFYGRDLTKRPVPGLVEGDRAIFLSGRDRVYALAAESGTIRWETTVEGVGTTAPVVAKGLVFVASHPSTLSKSNRRETLYALVATDGRVQWSLGADVTWGPARLIVGDNTIYFSTDKMLLAVELDTGQQLWSFSADQVGDINGDDHHLYVLTHKGSIARTRTTLHALALKTGQQKWSQGLGSAWSVGMLHEGVIYAARDAVDAVTGKTLWSFKGTGREEARLISEGRIFLISPTVTYSGVSRVDQGYLQALDAKTGRP
jgi:eukaryotic-like serine/threonine-protein kinase